MFSVSRFKDKVAVVAGAEHPLGVSLVRRLAGFGATVVAIGSDEGHLRALAAERPKRIEPLPLQIGGRDVLRLLQEAWADEPLDMYIDIFPLCEAMALAETRDVFSRSASLAAAFAPGIRAGRAQAILTFPQEGVGPADDRDARAAGFAAMVRHFDDKTAPGRFLGVAMLEQGCDWTGADCLSAGDAILMLCHPISRGVRPGSMVEWSA
ncbi:hypothetical protein [Primorskyibacter sp. 2E233]|uniref:hypothetical protein n=1 Tax=Primorskyibacter sp. 2E233 TaxID=3413431 RepID=UPI003BF3823E